MSPFVFLFEDGESPGARIARCAEQALADGPMGHRLRGDFYRHFVSCGFDPPLAKPYAGGDIGRIRTSCGIFCRGVLYWCGFPITKPGTVGGALVGGWLPGFSFGNYGWTWASEGVPEEGAIFYRDYAAPNQNWKKWRPSALGHVGVFVEHMGGSLWRTAEGGGNDGSSPESAGTVCRLSAPDGKDIRAKDSLGRLPIGWWTPAEIPLGDMPPTYPKDAA